MKPWIAPTRAPRLIPTTSAITQIQELSPMLPRSILTLKKAMTPSVWTSAIEYPRKPSSDPTDRSMFRDTMISTMPVAMMAIEVLCTDRFHRLREVRKLPPDRMLKAIQMTITAVIIPNSRVSTSARLERHDDAGVGVAAGAVTAGAGPDDSSVPSVLASSVMCSPPRHAIHVVHQTCPPPVNHRRGARSFTVQLFSRRYSTVGSGSTRPLNRHRRPCTGPRC